MNFWDTTLALQGFIADKWPLPRLIPRSIVFQQPFLIEQFEGF
jgi:hypothetical protein